MKKRYIVLIVFLVIVLLMFGIRFYNLNIREGSSSSIETTEDMVGDTSTEIDTYTANTTEVNEVQQSVEGSSDVETYTPSIGLHTDTSSSSNYVEIDESLTTGDVTQLTPNYPAVTKVWSLESVPTILQTYGANFTSSSLTVGLGTSLTDADKASTKQYAVGVTQNNSDLESGTLYSLTWLIDNLYSFSSSNAIKFTDLKVVKVMDDTSQTSLLCAYDFSDDASTNRNLVYLVDTSGTLKVDDFYAGAVLSTVVYAHNVDTIAVGTDTIVVIYFNTFTS